MTNLYNSHTLFAPALPLLLFASDFWASPTGLAKLVNLVIFVAILYLLLRKPTREYFRRRLAEVRETLDKAAREKKQATDKLAELDTRLNRLDADLREIGAQAERDAAAERERMQAEYKKGVEKIRETAAREVETAKQVALADLRAFTATSAVEMAEQMIRRDMTPADDAILVANAGKELRNLK